MKFSIIIPTYNEEKLIGNLLAGLSEEEIKNKFDYEIVVSDGGSKDGTREIAKKYADKFVEHSGNRRQLISEGRNKGAQISTGEVLIFINADIRIPNLELLFETIEKKFIPSNYVAMTCSVKVFPEEEIFADKIFLGFYNRYFSFLNFIGLGMGRGECQIVRRKDFFDLNGYDEKMAAGEDFDLFKRLRKKGKILFVQSYTVYESPRRYRKYGHVKVFFTWLANALSVIFLKKSASSQWEDIR